MNEHAPLLHNMSVPPRSTIQYQGLGDLVVQSGFGGSGLGSVAYEPGGTQGGVIHIALPADVQSVEPRRLLDALGVPPERDMSTQLLTLIEAKAAALPLPDACALKTRPQKDGTADSDLLTALAILSKCSGRVWLRSKQPSLVAALDRREAWLLVPSPWNEQYAQEWLR
jgi:hypothetical protein